MDVSHQVVKVNTDGPDGDDVAWPGPKLRLAYAQLPDTPEPGVWKVERSDVGYDFIRIPQPE